MLLPLWVLLGFYASLGQGLSSCMPHGLSSCGELFLSNRPDVLNLLNHQLQQQLANGGLGLGSFRRLCRDRSAILEGLQRAAPAGLLDDECSTHAQDVETWLAAAEAAGKTIVVPGVRCYSCGGEHLNIDCPLEVRSYGGWSLSTNENTGGVQVLQQATTTSTVVSPSAAALRSILASSGPTGAAAVLRSYSFACSRLLEAAATAQLPPSCYSGWLKAHGSRWALLADACEAEAGASDPAVYSTALSMFYNWIDTEASTAGIVASASAPAPGGATTISLADALEDLEPGYAATRDKHQSFVADITGAAQNNAKKDAAAAKVNAAAAYLAAKKKKQLEGS